MPFKTRQSIYYISRADKKKLKKIKKDKGFDSVGLLKLIGGINRGRPDENDLKRAECFAIKLLSDLKYVK